MYCPSSIQFVSIWYRFDRCRDFIHFPIISSLWPRTNSYTQRVWDYLILSCYTLVLSQKNRQNKKKTFSYFGWLENDSMCNFWLVFLSISEHVCRLTVICDRRLCCRPVWMVLHPKAIIFSVILTYQPGFPLYSKSFRIFKFPLHFKYYRVFRKK